MPNSSWSFLSDQSGRAGRWNAWQPGAECRRTGIPVLNRFEDVEHLKNATMTSMAKYDALTRWLGKQQSTVTLTFGDIECISATRYLPRPTTIGHGGETKHRTRSRVSAVHG